MTIVEYAFAEPKLDFSWAKETDTIFLDADQVLYEPCTSIIDQFWAVSYQTILKFLPHLTYEDAVELAKQSWKEYRSGYDFLIHKHGCDAKEVIHSWHENLDPGFVVPFSRQFLEKMQQAAKNYVVITQGSFLWGRDLVIQSGIRDFVPDKNIVSLEHTFPELKSTHPSPYLRAIEITDCNPFTTPIIEDSQSNLPMAKQLGLLTFAVHQPIGTVQQICTDYMMQKPEMVFDAIIAEKNKSTLKPIIV